MKPKEIKSFSVYLGTDGTYRKVRSMKDDWLMWSKPDKRTVNGWSRSSEFATLEAFAAWAESEVIQ